MKGSDYDPVASAWHRSVAGVVVGFAAGALPLSNWAARYLAGTDLRQVGSGTVSGTGLAGVAGTRALFVVGLGEVAKGAVGPLVAGPGRPAAQALAAAAAVCGHNWSPWLGGAGGRGISPAMGAMAVTAPAGSVVLLAGLALGRLLGETAVGSLAADAALVPVAGRRYGRAGGWVATAVLVPMVVKRLTGNARPGVGGPRVYLCRLLFDRDTRRKAVLN